MSIRQFNEQQQIRREKLKQIQALGIDPFYSTFRPNTNSEEFKKHYDHLTKEQLENNETKHHHKISGRIMMFRDAGKAAFLSIRDEAGLIQFYIKSDEVSEKQWALLKLLDMGDIIGCEGIPMKTKTEELTLRANSLDIVAKSLTPLPDKFHGLEDVEEKYRRRYLDLIVSPESKKTFETRFKVIQELRAYLSRKGFYEVETPILSSIVGGAAAKPFHTHHNALDMPLTLRIATELPLKRLIVGGFDKVYEIGRIFRNEGISNRHNPEFTSIELYQAYSDMEGMINISEDIINHLAKSVLGKEEVEYDGVHISLKKPFKRVEMSDLVKEVTGVDFKHIHTLDEAKKVAKEHGIQIQKHWDSVGYFLNAFFEEKGEKACIQPTYVTGYPVEVSPLAKLRHGSKTITDRFELFINAREYANAFSELNDADDQYGRFLNQLKEREAGNEEATDMDIDFIEALEYGMPPTGGLGIGIDRLVMLFTNSHTIKDVILFPLQRSRNEK